MKKLLLLLLLSVFVTGMTVSCTPERLTYKDELQIDKDCQTNPDGTTNCDGDDNGEG